VTPMGAHLPLVEDGEGFNSRFKLPDAGT